MRRGTIVTSPYTRGGWEGYVFNFGMTAFFTHCSLLYVMRYALRVSVNILTDITDQHKLTYSL
jgi:hypothetical protein